MKLSHPLLLVWVALMLLLVSTVVASQNLTGPFSLAVNLTIAFAKAALIYWFYMHLRQESGLARLAALAAGGWLAILFLFLSLDYVTR
ncbi:cytochrome C oxidase subunit IV family protein [Mycoplana dimorpha]|uniref:Cytochrome c oxidase subunit 4 n=1 Tax=Mycoplana dimorpha TaxID=28320 RepID=A0A2T5AJS4_MYCDI|nr:cytochrome C oxidase subunit IV family protein [Mycoplana dimorpha]PTM86965.1 cytochrome c oxidase subunit 4 [Mycoplana dimorpha]